MNAARTAFVSFRAIKDRVSIQAILDHYGLLEGLTPRGTDTLAGPCPVHGGTHSSQFRVSLSKNCWNCFGPCSGGNILDFVAQRERVSLSEAARLIDQWFPETAATAPSQPERLAQERPPPKARRAAGAMPPHEDPPPAAPASGPGQENPVLPFERLKNLDFGHACLRGERGFDRATLEHFGVGYCTKGLHKGRIAIPVHNRAGQLVAYVGQDLATGAYHYHEAFCHTREVYNLHRLPDDSAWTGEPLVLVTDYFEVLRLHEAGQRNAVALLNEDPSEHQLRLLLERVGEAGRILLVGQRQEAGMVHRLASLVRLFYVHVRFTETRLRDLSTEQVRELFADQA